MSEEELRSKITINVKTATEEKSIEIEEDATVEELKEEIANQFNITVEQVHLIFAGKFLRNHEDIKKHNIKDGATVFLDIRYRNVTQQEASNNSPTRNQGSLPVRDASAFDDIPNLGDSLRLFNIENDSALIDIQQRIERDLAIDPSISMSQLLNNPVRPPVSNSGILRGMSLDLLQPPEFQNVREILEEIQQSSSSLETVDRSQMQRLAQSIIQIHPEFPQTMMDSVAFFENNPESMQQIHNLFQQISSNAQTPLSEIFLSNPGGFQTFVQLARGMDLNMFNPRTGNAATTTTTAGTSSVSSPPTSAAPNITGTTAAERFRQIMATMSSINLALPEERYQSQLDELAAMGFVDREANLRALIDTFGDITGAIESLLLSTENNNE